VAEAEGASAAKEQAEAQELQEAQVVAAEEASPWWRSI
jgi:hypothetical protein